MQYTTLSNVNTCNLNGLSCPLTLKKKTFYLWVFFMVLVAYSLMKLNIDKMR